MHIVTVLIVAFGLAMDAFAASLASGAVLKGRRFGNAFRIALFFGLFQSAMPAIGWFLTFKVNNLITHVDHWIAFALLTFIGLKMIVEAIRSRNKVSRPAPLGTALLLLLSLATSIDAFAAGVSFGLLNISIVMPIVVIGTVTFMLSLIGVLITRKIGTFAGNWAGVLGGVILVGIGIKVLVDHIR